VTGYADRPANPAPALRSGSGTGTVPQTTRKTATSVDDYADALYRHVRAAVPLPFCACGHAATLHPDHAGTPCLICDCGAYRMCWPRLQIVPGRTLRRGPGA
jgi:hypothetical protein